MSLPTSEPLPDDSSQLPPARRRRGRRLVVPIGADERAALLDELAHRTTPSFDFFLYALLAGAVWGAGLLLDAPAFLLLGALFAPFMAPVIGLSLATIVGSARFFLQTLGGALVGFLLVFIGGVLGGLAAHIWPGLTLSQASSYYGFSWPNFLVLSLGVVLTTLSLVRSKQKPLLPSVAIAYELCLPIAVAGFGLSSGAARLWPGGLVVALVYFTWSALLGTLTLAALKFRPLNLFGYTLGTTVTLLSLILLIGLTGLGTALREQIAVPGIQATSTPTPTASSTATLTPRPSTSTPTPTKSLIPSSTPTRTGTPIPTPVWALIKAQAANGGVIRSEPGYNSPALTSILNGTLVQILPGTQTADGVVWAHVLTNQGQEGWMVQSLLVTATPAPDW